MELAVCTIIQLVTGFQPVKTDMLPLILITNPFITK
jgi:hypothetical protein